MIYLYVKTHSITGLKYLGKTNAKDPHKYKGSGKRWNFHLRKHGAYYTTEIIFQSKDKEEIKNAGIYYSRLWNIIASNEWANLKEECGDGGWDHILKTGINNIWSDQRRKQKSESVKSLHDRGIYKKTYFDGQSERSKKALLRAASQEVAVKRKESLAKINHQQKSKNSQYGTT